MKEMTGSGIFKGKGENGLSEADEADETSANKTGLRMYQVTPPVFLAYSINKFDAVKF